MDVAKKKRLGRATVTSKHNVDFTLVMTYCLVRIPVVEAHKDEDLSAHCFNLDFYF